MKRATVEATFPELRGNCYASGTGTGSTPRVAIGRAIDVMLRSPNVKGKSVHAITCKITVVEVHNEPN